MRALISDYGLCGAKVNRYNRTMVLDGIKRKFGFTYLMVQRRRIRDYFFSSEKGKTGEGRGGQGRFDKRPKRFYEICLNLP